MKISLDWLGDYVAWKGTPEELAALPPCKERAEVCDNGQDENCNGHLDEGCAFDAGPAGLASGGAGSGGTGEAPFVTSRALAG